MMLNIGHVRCILSREGKGGEPLVETPMYVNIGDTE